MARRASDEAGVRRRIIGVARFSTSELQKQLEAEGIETIRCELLDRRELDALPDAPNVLVVGTSVAGDFSPYTLRLVDDITQAQEAPFELTDVLAGFDSQLAEVEFSFKVECPPNFDCAPLPPDCPPALPPPAPINYLAKDYGSFRSTMLDRLSQLLPGWSAATVADLGVALTELIAYVGG